jgi:hypothetical protein
MPQVKMNDLALISVEREELNVVNINGFLRIVAPPQIVVRSE